MCVYEYLAHIHFLLTTLQLRVTRILSRGEESLYGPRVSYCEKTLAEKKACLSIKSVKLADTDVYKVKETNEE